MKTSTRVIGVTAIGAVAVSAVVGWLVFRASAVNDPANAECAHPQTQVDAPHSQGDHAEVEVRFRCEDALLAGTIYLPTTPGRHPGVVWVHGAGEEPRLTWGGQLLPGLVRAGVAVLSYDKRGVGESQGECCPGDAGHFNLLTADVVGAVHVLRQHADVDPDRVGLVGASQAGWIIPRAAVESHALFVALASASTVAERTTNLYERLARGEDGNMTRSEISDLTVTTFQGAGHGLLDNPPSDPAAIPSLIEWVAHHDG
jgi:pimeloyl-ACP methyl ester carboxylesterase